MSSAPRAKCALVHSSLTLFIAAHIYHAAIHNSVKHTIIPTDPNKDKSDEPVYAATTSIPPKMENSADNITLSDLFIVNPTVIKVHYVVLANICGEDEWCVSSVGMSGPD